VRQPAQAHRPVPLQFHLALPRPARPLIRELVRVIFFPAEIPGLTLVMAAAETQAAAMAGKPFALILEVVPLESAVAIMTAQQPFNLKFFDRALDGNGTKIPLAHWA
jgi:hypothetical protein